MHPSDLASPLAGMVALTFGVIVSNLILRVKAFAANKGTLAYFKVFQGDPPSERMAQFRNHISNLFEVPVLFYAVCLLNIALGSQVTPLVTLGWVYVGLRLVHTLVHLTYNKVIHRVVPFMLSNVTLVVMWVVTFRSMPA